MPSALSGIAKVWELRVLRLRPDDLRDRESWESILPDSELMQLADIAKRRFRGMNFNRSYFDYFPRHIILWNPLSSLIRSVLNFISFSESTLKEIIEGIEGDVTPESIIKTLLEFSEDVTSEKVFSSLSFQLFFLLTLS